MSPTKTSSMKQTNMSEIVGALLCLAALAPGPGSAFAQSSKKSADSGEMHGIQGFSVALVLGDMQGAASADNLPPGAKKALGDMRDFLPYKSYRLLDTQWILCCGSAKGGAGVAGRLRGLSVPPGISQVYGFAVNVLGVAGPQLSIRFVMDDGSGAASKTIATKITDAEGSDNALYNKFKQDQELLEMMLADARKQHSPQHPAVKEIESKLDTIRTKEQQVSGARGGSGKGAVIDSTFSMDLGETVVIGTSSLKGEQALIAVLTAVRRPIRPALTQEQP